jgi:rhomboid protease GluP
VALNIPVLLLIAANVVMFILTAFSARSVMDIPVAVLLEWGANVGPLTIGHEWWRLLSSMFLHAGIIHIAVNMVSLWYLGRVAHRRFGDAAFMAAYFIGGLGASLASVSLHSETVSVGASGAIFGLLGTLFAATFARNPEMRSVQRQVRSELLKVLGINLLIGFSIPHIDNAAHIGGLVTGFLYGMAIVMVSGDAPRATRRQVAAISAAAAVVLLVAMASVGHWRAPAPGSYEEVKSQVADELQEQHSNR